MLLDPHQIQQEIPLSSSEKAQVDSFRGTIGRILSGEDKRLLLIAGPCSIHHLGSAKEYAKRLHALSLEVKDSFFIVMRTYFEKSRTTIGWKGLISDPLRDGTNDIIGGIRLARTFLKELIALGLPAGLEFLDPFTSEYLKDQVSWGSIGARTVQSQIHRQLASSLPMPIGFKNTTDGNIHHAVKAALVAGHPHSFLHMNAQGRLEIKNSSGNVFPHIVLRGGEGCPKACRSNFDSTSILEALAFLESETMPPRLLIDCSHDNSGRDPARQKEVFCHIVDEIVGRHAEVRGIMLESYLEEGANSEISQSHVHANISITDPCIGWAATEALVRYAHSALKGSSCVV